MGCKCAPALLALRDELNALFPNRDKSSDGCCGDAAHQARKSDHNPAQSGRAQGYARAFDFDEDIVSTMGEQELWAMALLLLGDPRTKMEIYEKQALYPDGTIKPYSGVNDHRHHLHLSIHDSAVFDTKPWGIARAFQQEDEDMDANQDRLLTETATKVANIDYLLANSILPAIARLDSARAAGTDPKAFAAEVAKHIPGVTEDQLEQAFRNVLIEGVG